MNILIRDREPFERLNPVEVAAYLRSRGWNEVEVKPDVASVWVTKVGRENLEVILPLQRTMSSFVLRMSEIVGGVAAAEKRSELDVLRDLRTAGADVIRVRYQHENAKDGSIPLDQGEKLVEQAREMMLAGACAAVQPRPVYVSKKPEAAVDFVRNLRMGQTEIGSYVLTIHSPVTPEIPYPNGRLCEVEEPFERRAVIQVATALLALRNATNQSISAPDSRIFDELVAKGVSGNLCSALVGMNGKDSQPTDELSISFSYAATRHVEADTPREIRFPRDHMGLIGSAANFYKAKAPPEEMELRGFVVALRSEDKSAPVAGPITIKGLFKGESRKIQIDLSADDHTEAIRAYQNRLEVTCTGELAKTGNLWNLKNPRKFAIIED